MLKFFVKSEQIYENKIIIVGKDINHIKNVLRSQIGEKIIVGDEETGESYICQIEVIEKEFLQATIIEKLKEQREPHTYIHIFQGLPKADKMEQIIKKGTEIGVSEFTPIRLERCVVKLNDKDSRNKVERWQKVAEAAAKQCKRDKIPKVNSVYNLKNIYEILKEYDIVLLAYEEEKKHQLKEELKKIKKENLKIAIIIGPEGGITENEVKELEQYGTIPVTLGKRILRTETAPIVIATIILYELGDFN